MRIVLAILLLVTGQASTGTLRVTIVDRETQAPLPSVTVRAVGSRGAELVEFAAETGPDGTADFGSLPAGRYEVVADSDTHLVRDGIQPDPFPWSPPEASRVLVRWPGVAYARVDAGALTSVRLSLARGGVINGRVRVAEGERSGLEVRLTTASPSARPVLGHKIQSHTGRTTTLDGTGRFAFSGLPPGGYYVAVARTSAEGAGSNGVYYPGVVDFHEATPVRVDAGRQIQIEFEAPTIPAASIRGRVMDPSGRPGELVSRRLDFTTGDVVSHLIVPLDRSGSFSLPSASGIESLLYTRRVNGETVAAATRALHVGTGSQDGVRLRAVPTARIRGRFQFSQPYDPQPHDVDPVVSLIPVGDDAALREGLVDFRHEPVADGFRVSGIFGVYRVDARAPEGWIVEAIVLEHGRNVLDETIRFEPGRTYQDVRVMLSPLSATITGRVSSFAPRAAQRELASEPDPRVIVFPVDEESWSIWRLTHVTDPAPDGSFRVRGVTPGRTYYVASCAWPCASSPEYLRALIPVATRIFVDRPGVFAVTLDGKYGAYDRLVWGDPPALRCWSRSFTEIRGSDLLLLLS